MSAKTGCAIGKYNTVWLIEYHGYTAASLHEVISELKLHS